MAGEPQVDDQVGAAAEHAALRPPVELPVDGAGIFFASRSSRSSDRCARIRRIQRSFFGTRENGVPRREPGPECRPFATSAAWSRARARDVPATAMRRMTPALIALRMSARVTASASSSWLAGSM